MILSLSGHRNELDGGNKEEDALFFEHEIPNQNTEPQPITENTAQHITKSTH